MVSTPESPDWPRLAGLLRLGFQRLSADALDGLRGVLEEARGLLDCAEAGLMVPSASPNELRFLVSVNSAPRISDIVLGLVVPCDRSIAGYVFTTGNLVARTNPDLADPDRFYRAVDQATGLVTVHYLAVPVFDDGQVLGVATFVNRPPDRVGESFGAREIDLAQGVTQLLAVGLQHYRQASLQQGWMEQALDRALAVLGPAGGDDPAAGPAGGDGPWGASRPPILRTLAQIERLSAEHQELAAELIACVTRHLGP